MSSTAENKPMLEIMILKLPVKLNDNYTCKGRDADDAYIAFDDLLSEGERVPTVQVGDGDDADQCGPYGLVVMREDGLWIEAEE